MDEHATVLLEESVEALNLTPRSVVVDATVGQGGHTKKILETVGDSGTVLALDADRTSLEKAREVLGNSAHVIYMQGNFRHLIEHAARAGITSADAVLFDLGWHSGQLMSGRGFSFKEQAPLLMTLDPEAGSYSTTAGDIIATWPEVELALLFKKLGDERFSGRIARAIVEAREKKEIETAAELGEVILHAVPKQFQKRRTHPATRVFQALRMHVNDELGALKDGLDGAYNLIVPGGRIAVITFHSLEDRVVKLWMREKVAEGGGSLITKKPIVPSRSEQKNNPRSRSAKLRIFEKHA